MLALSPAVFYLHEPFNQEYYRPGICGARFKYRFTYITADNEAKYLPHLQRTAALRYHWAGALRSLRSLEDWRTVGQEAAAFRHARRLGRRPLFKDPLAMLSAGWLATRFGMDVVILVRHPAAFASSIKRFNWRSPLSELLDQPLLIRDYLAPLAEEIGRYASDQATVVQQAAVFWKALYYVADHYRRQFPNWHFVRHEDLSRDPLAGFARLYGALGLTFSDRIAAVISDYSSAKNPAEAAEDQSIAHLDSESNIWNWKQRLSAAEIDQIYKLTEPVAGRFYEDEMW
jgi:hypothetical protein